MIDLGGLSRDALKARLETAERQIADLRTGYGELLEEREIKNGQIAALRAAQEWQDINTAVAAEREACAHIADAVGGRAAKAAMELSYGELYGEQCKEEAAEEIANAIRARGTLIAEERGTK